MVRRNLSDSECEAAAIVEGLNLRDRCDARARARCRSPTTSIERTDDVPARRDHVRLSAAYWDNEIEAMRGQRAQDQVEVAGRVIPDALARRGVAYGARDGPEG